MFDDQMNTPGSGAPKGQVPPNLPTAEPEDMFAGVEENTPVQPVADNATTMAESPLTATEAAPPQAAPSALGAGVLKPAQGSQQQENMLAQEPEVAMSSAMQEPQVPVTPEAVSPIAPPQQAASPQMPPAAPPSEGMFATQQPAQVQTPPQIPRDQDYSIKEPTLSRGIMTAIIAAVVFVILIGGGWWIYNAVFSNTPTDTPTNIPTTDVDNTNQQNDVVTPPPNNTTTGEVPSGNSDERLLFGAPKDSDGDGLDDEQEASLDLDPNDWDSDNDELSDGDEVLIWETDAKNPDTDGDSYLDGTEVKSGYNPKGPGRIFEPPNGSNTSRDQSATASNNENAAIENTPFGEIGSCSEEQVDALVLDAIDMLRAQGYSVDADVWNDEEIFPILVEEVGQRLTAVCGVTTTPQAQ